jgi:hypothetical protein
MNTKPTRESGQILIIFVVALTGLLAFTALAIDGGMVYADRRLSQSTSDTASLAGAGAAAQYLEKNGVTWVKFSCTNPKVIASFNVAYEAARQRAINNQILDLDHDLSDKHGIEVKCVNDPDHFEKYIDVHTMVTSSVSTSFAHIFFPDPIKNTVNSVTRIHPRTEFAYGHAIVSLGDSCGTNDGGVVFDGTSDVFVHGGGVFSNTCINASGNVHVDVTSGGIDYVGNLSTNGHPVLDPDPTQTPMKMPRQDIGVPDCGSGGSISSNNGGVISPGNYSQIKLTNGSLTLNPGAYCVSGNISISGGEIIGDGVTIYMKNSNSSLTINGNASSHLNAPTDSNLVGGAKVGVLIYMADGNTGNIKLEGTAESSFAGLIYAPDGTIDVGGTSDLNPTYNTQLVGNYVKVHGTSRIEINYNTFPPNTVQPALDVME